MRIGIMSAMIEENLLLSKKLSYQNIFQSAGRTYYKGHYLGHEIVIAFSRWGKIASSITATHLINEFKVEKLIFTGVAGSAHSHIKTGDVVVAKSLIQHDMDARPLFAKHEIPLINKTRFDVDDDLYKKTLMATNAFMKQFPDYLTHEDIASFNLKQPKVHSGLIASGDKFFSSKKDLEALTCDIPEALCVEMEGASVAQVCFEHELPFCVVRTISDGADENASHDFPKFVKQVASPYSLGIINNLLPLL
jgi:adenosylhomocysteine nucleosidase